MNFKRLGVAAAGVFLLAASTIFGQDAGRRLDGTANRLDRSPVSSSVGGLTTGRVTLSDGTTKITDDAGLTYNRTTDTLAVTNGKVAASNLTASGLATPGGITVTPTLTQVGSITTVAGSALVDGDYFTIKYDGGTVPIEFDLSPGDGTTGGRIPLLFTAGDSADLIRDNVILALNAAAPTKLTASSGGAATVAIVLDTPGATGDTNTENVADAGFAVTGFADPTHATTVTYQLVACLADGSCTQAGADSTTGTSVATLTASNLNRLSWSAVPGAASYKVYRKVAPTSPATVGVIYTGTGLTVDDTGLVGDTTTASTIDGTGRVTADGFTMATGAGVGKIFTSDGAGNGSWAAGGAGTGTVTNTGGDLTANALMVGAGGVDSAVLASLGTTTTVLHGNAAGAPTFGAVALAADVSGTLPIANGGTGADLSAITTGGLITGTGAGTVGVKAAGANGTYLKANDAVAGGVEWAAGGGGITNSAGANVIPKSDGTNLVASAISDNGSGTVSVGAASGTPTAYTFKLAADGTGTNSGAASATILPGIGTGSGAASRLLLGGPKVGSSGSTVQSTATPVSIGGEVKADGTESFLNVTGTLPASPSAAVSAAKIDVTSAGTAAQYQQGLELSLSNGYTGSAGTHALRVTNTGKSSGTLYYTGNNAGWFRANGNAASLNVGSYGDAVLNTTTNAGTIGYASADGTNAIGVMGAAAATGTNAAGVLATFRFIGDWSPANSLGTAKAALIADNHTVAAPIALFRDNGTRVFAVNDGGGVNLMREVEANTAGSGAPNVLVATESHSVLTNEGATAANYHTLPTAAKGLTYTFVVQDADGLRITANTDDTIRVAATVTAAAGYITSSTIGDTVTLVAINAVEWVAVSALGTWTAGP